MLVVDIPSLLIGFVLGGLVFYAFKKGKRNE